MSRARRMAALLLALALLPTIALAAAAPLAQSDFTFTAAAGGDLPATSAPCTLGALCADAALAGTGAQAALIPGALLSGSLPAGAVFASDFARVIPEDAPLLLASLSPAQLYALLEEGVSHLVIGEGDRVDAAASAYDGYPQVGGITWRCDASAPAGARVLEVKLDGQPLDPADTQTSLRVVSTARLLGDAGADAGLTLRQALERYAAAQGTLREPDARTTVIGTASYPLIDRFPIAALVVGCVLLFALASIPKMKYERQFSFRPRLSMFRRLGKMHPEQDEPPQE